MAFPRDPFSMASPSTGAAPWRGWQLEEKLSDGSGHDPNQKGERGGISEHLPLAPNNKLTSLHLWANTKAKCEQC